MPDPNLDPTTGYKTPPKGPNFGLIVGLACVAFVIIMVATIVILRSKATKMDPHAPNPTPNSLVLPATVRPYPQQIASAA